MDDEQKKQKRLENLAKARAKIMELRAEKEKLCVKTKDEKPVQKMVESSEVVEKETANVVDKVDKEDVVEEEPVTKEPAKEVAEPVKKERKKREYKKVEKSEPIVIENKPVKLTFTRGDNGLFYM